MHLGKAQFWVLGFKAYATTSEESLISKTVSQFVLTVSTKTKQYVLLQKKLMKTVSNFFFPFRRSYDSISDMLRVLVDQREKIPSLSLLTLIKSTGICVAFKENF